MLRSSQEKCLTLDPFALRHGELPAHHARLLSEPRRRALLACLHAGRLEQIRHYFMPPGGSEICAGSTVRALAASGLFILLEPAGGVRRSRVRLSVTGDWYARTLSAEGGGMTEFAHHRAAPWPGGEGFGVLRITIRRGSEGEIDIDRLMIAGPFKTDIAAWCAAGVIQRANARHNAKADR